MNRPTASLSLDLDNKWTYMRTHGVPGWEDRPSYLELVAPRCLDFCHRHGVRITIFVVGSDLESDENCKAVASFAEAGHEIANHSLSHYCRLDALPPEKIEEEVAAAERIIEERIGVRTVGFRAPGFSGSPQLLEILARRSYAYDASQFPTILGPLASWRAKTMSVRNNAKEPRQKFATLQDGLRPIRPYVVETPGGILAEVPVTTMPLFRIPIHATYLMFLREKSLLLATSYLRLALAMARLRGVAPSYLLHPLDFLGRDDAPDLDFFPGMKLDAGKKIKLLDQLVTRLSSRFDLRTVADHAAAACPSVAFNVPSEIENSLVAASCD